MRGMVTSSQVAASRVGADVLRRGGNAADAAVAMAAALNVTEPCSTGIGGDCFALYFAGDTITALNGSGRAPEALSLERVSELTLFDANAVTVPGACAGWFDLIARHGTWQMADILAPAIDLAENGFEVQPVTAHFWSAGFPHLTSDELGIEGRAPRAGETFHNPGLARTFRLIAEHGPDALYRGPIGEAIVAVLRQRGGSMGLKDLGRHYSTWEQPVSTDLSRLSRLGMSSERAGRRRAHRPEHPKAVRHSGGRTVARHGGSDAPRIRGRPMVRCRSRFRVDPGRRIALDRLCTRAGEPDSHGSHPS